MEPLAHTVRYVSTFGDPLFATMEDHVKAMKLLSRLAWATAIVAGSASLGCSGAAADDDAIVDDGAEIKAGAFLGEVGAIRRDHSPLNITGERLQLILENLGLQKNAKKPKRGALRCLPKETFFLLKPNGEPLATVELACDEEKRTNVPGTLKVGSDSYLITAKDIDDINIVSYDASRVGDFFFTANRATIGGIGRDNVEVPAAKIGSVLSALKTDEKPDFSKTSSGMRCPPSRMVTIYNGTQSLGTIAMTCSEAERGWITAIMTPAAGRPGYAAIPAGISVNAGAIFTLEKSLNK